MSGLQKFFRENIKQVNETKIVKLSDRVPEFTLQPVKQTEIMSLADRYLNMQTTKNGQVITKSNSKGYFMELLERTVVEPDLYNAELQDSWGATEPEGLLNAMLTNDEFGLLMDKVNEVNGSKKSMDEMVEEVKN